MRVDQAPFDKKEIRQALALALDRPALVDGLMNGKADLGNDSPFAPAFPSTDTSVAQRAQDLAQAMQLMTTAGVPNGFDVTLYTWNGFEMPQLAQLIQQAAAQIKINIKLQVDDASTYYSKFWLDSSLGITDYGHRGVPNVFLAAPLLSDGTWNAAHYKNPAYDALVKQYVAAVDPTAQKAAAKGIETLLLDDTPISFPYFYNHMSASKPTVLGAEFTGMGHIRLTKAGLQA
jgi:peptide/nickel transport system substrate-binding protein